MRYTPEHAQEKQRDLHRRLWERRQNLIMLRDNPMTTAEKKEELSILINQYNLCIETISSDNSVDPSISNFSDFPTPPSPSP